jgi:hypothetical protein
MTMATVGNESSVALARRAPDESFALALEPQSFTDAMAFAEVISKSGMWAPKGQSCLTPQQALMRLMTGRNLGIPAVIAMEHVYDLYGRTGISAKLKDGLARRHPHCELFEHVSSDVKSAVWKVKRRGSPEQLVTYTIEDAQRAGIVKPDSNWQKHPRRMLQARARSEAADIWFPDATMGLPTVDEIEDEMVGDVVLPNAPPAQAAPARDFLAEADDLKQAIADAANGTTEDKKAVREMFKKFEADAPAAISADVKAFYNMAIGQKKANGAKAEAHGQPMPTSNAKRVEYVPPHLRGDSYEGPDEPDPPFGSPSQGSMVR